VKYELPHLYTSDNQIDTQLIATSPTHSKSTHTDTHTHTHIHKLAITWIIALGSRR